MVCLISAIGRWWAFFLAVRGVHVLGGRKEVYLFWAVCGVPVGTRFEVYWPSASRLVFPSVGLRSPVFLPLSRTLMFWLMQLYTAASSSTEVSASLGGDHLLACIAPAKD